MIAMLLLVAGLLLVPSTGTVLAVGNPDSLVVSAVVSGPPPLAAATIDSPADGDDYTTKPISVTGTCPTTSYVQLFRNNVPSGTALCTTSGTYSVSTDLFDGANELFVRVYNYAMVAGPDSGKITVTYTPPKVVTPEPPVTGDGGGNNSGSGSTGSGGSSTGGTTTSPSTPGRVTSPLLLRNDYIYRGFYVGQPAVWNVAVGGGSVPYSISVKWGDGEETLYTSRTAETLTLTHVYDKAGAQDGSYIVTVNATDADGATASLQILGIVNDVPNGAVTGGSTGGSAPLKGAKVFGIYVRDVVFYVWTTYGTLCLVVFGFWLGEMRELRLIRAKFRLRRL